MAAGGHLNAPEEATPEKDAPAPKTADAKYWDVRDRRAKALRNERILARDKGEWVQAADARAAMTKLVMEVVREHEMIVRRLSPLLVGVATAVEAAGMLEDAFRTLQDRISRERAVGEPLKRGRGRPRGSKNKR